MLLDRDRPAEPADVAEVGEDRRRARLGNEARRELLAEQVLVADVGRNPLAFDLERRRGERAALEVAERDVHHAREPVEAVGDELAERHQVVLVVAVEPARVRDRVGGDADRRVGVATLRVAEGNAEDRRPARHPEALEQALPPLVVELAEQDRDHRLRADDQLAARRLDLRRRRGEPGGEMVDVELLLLRHVALQQRDRERARRRREVDPAEERAGDEHDDQRSARRDPAARTAQVGEAEAGGERRCRSHRCRTRRATTRIRRAARRRTRSRSRPTGSRSAERRVRARRAAMRRRTGAPCASAPARASARRAPSPPRGRARERPRARAPRARQGPPRGRRRGAC